MLAAFEHSSIGQYVRPNLSATSRVYGNEATKTDPMSYYERRKDDISRFSATQIEDIYQNYVAGNLNLPSLEKAQVTLDKINTRARDIERNPEYLQYCDAIDCQISRGYP